MGRGIIGQTHQNLKPATNKSGSGRIPSKPYPCHPHPYVRAYRSSPSSFPFTAIQKHFICILFYRPQRPVRAIARLFHRWYSRA